MLYVGLDPSSSKEKRDEMLDAMIAFYLEMKSKMESGDPKQREAAMRKLAEIQATLTARKNALCEMTGLTPTQLETLSNHPCLGKEHEAVTEAKARLQKILNPDSRPKQPKKGLIPV